jgi:exosome complex component MTR3
MNRTNLNILPEESWDPLNFMSSDDLKKVLDNKKKNSNETASKGKKNIFLKTDCVSEASGSSYVELGNTKMLCSIYGPRDIPRRDDYDFKVAHLNCEFRFSAFSCLGRRRGTLQSRDQSLDEKNFSEIIEEALKPSILLYKYPKSQIDIYLLCIQNDVDSENVLSAGIIAASMALCNSSIELYDLVSAYTIPSINLTISYMPSLHQVTSLHFSNETNGSVLSCDLTKSYIKESIESCKNMYSYMRSVLLDKFDCLNAINKMEI